MSLSCPLANVKSTYRTMTNVLLKKEYPKEYTTTVSTRVSNALLVGEVIGQVVIGQALIQNRVRATC